MDRVFEVVVDGVARGLAPDFGRAVERAFAALSGHNAAHRLRLDGWLAETPVIGRLDLLALAIRRRGVGGVVLLREHDLDVAPDRPTVVGTFDLKRDVYPSFETLSALVEVSMGRPVEDARRALEATLRAAFPPEADARTRFVEDGRMVGRFLGSALADDIFLYEGWDGTTGSSVPADAGFPEIVLAAFDKHVRQRLAL